MTLQTNEGRHCNNHINTILYVLKWSTQGHTNGYPYQIHCFIREVQMGKVYPDTDPFGY
jgi:hypothetical protein